MADLDPRSGEFLDRLRGYVRRRVPSSWDADDVMQTVMLRTLESNPVGREDSTQAWLSAVARSAIVDLHRVRARSVGPLIEDHGMVANEPEDASDITECLLPVLAGLSSEDQVLLRRVDLEGRSQAELARELGLSASGVKSRVQRARARLRTAVIARCAFERDARGDPVGPATCRPGTSGEDCGCRAEAPGEPGCG